MNPRNSLSLVSLFKGTAKVILLGVILFSIVRNIRGLDLEFAGVSFIWQVLIAVTITLASSVLTGSSIVIQSENYVKWLLFLCGILFSTVSFFLSYSGAVADIKGKHLNQIAHDPQVTQLMQEIEDIIDRANAYGISERQKMSMLQREKELRQDLRQARERAIMQAQNKSRKEEINLTGIALFAVLPELGIITFTIVIVLLSGQNVVSSAEAEGVITYPNEQHYPSLPEPAPTQPQLQRPQSRPTMINNHQPVTNNHVPPPSAQEQSASNQTQQNQNWSPFA